jgi:hypothetical protein
MRARHAEDAQGGEHDAGIVRIEQLVDDRLAFGQGCQQQRPIGDALRPGQPHAPAHAGDRGDVEMIHPVRNRRVPLSAR